MKPGAKFVYNHPRLGHYPCVIADSHVHGKGDDKTVKIKPESGKFPAHWDGEKDVPEMEELEVPIVMLEKIGGSDG